MNKTQQFKVRLFFSYVICGFTVGYTFAQSNMTKETLGELTKQNIITSQNSKTQIVSLEIPELIYPLNNAANVPIVPKFIIGTVKQADRYEMQIGFDQYFSSLVSTAYWQFDTPLTTNQLTWFPSISKISNFKNNTNYYWRVRVSANNQTETSPWSEPYHYTTKTSAGAITLPTLNSPTNNSTLPWLNVILQWNQETAATWYQIQWSTSSNFDSYYYRWTTVDNPIIKTDLKPATDYYWRIVAFNDNSISQFSSKGNFRTGNQVVLTESEYTFDDGSGSDNYEGNLDISWLIKPQNSKQINLSFLSFNTESGYDFVTVYDGSTTSSPILGKFSGTSLPTSIKSSQGTMLIRFTSDWFTVKTGWRAKYESFIESCEPLDITTSLSKISGPWSNEYDGSFGSIAISSSNPNFLLIGNSVLGGGVYKSTDGGKTWLLSMNGIEQLGLFTKRCPPISKIIIHPINSNIVYLSTAIDNSLTVGGSGNIYKSTNAGTNWVKASGTTNWLGIPQIQGSIYDFGVDPQNPNTLYAGATAQGVFKSTDGGTTWEKIISASVAIGAVDYFNVVKTTTTGEIYVSGFRYYSEDVIPLWITWEYNTFGIPGIMPLGLKKSTDGGSTWKDIGTAFTPLALVTDLTLELSTNNLYASTMAYQTPIYIPIGNKGIFQSSDFGETWFKPNDVCQGSLSQYPLFSLFSSSNNQKKIIGTTSGFRGLVISTNSGTSWKLVKGFPTDAFIVGCALSEPNNFVATSKGIYSFSIQNSTLVKPLDLINEHFSLYQNYPNPFNPTTSIKYSIPAVETRRGESLQNVTLKVYDILGSEITTLVNEAKAPGNYEIKLDGSKLSSGVYFYRLQAGQFNETKKFILMK